MELIESHKEKLSWGLFLLLVVGIIGRISFPEHLYPGDPYWVRVQAQAWLDGRGDVPLPYAVHPPMEKGQFFFCCPRNNQYHIKYGVLITAFTRMEQTFRPLDLGHGRLVPEFYKRKS